MKRTPKVATVPLFKTSMSSSLLNYETRDRAVLVGRRADESEAASGLIGKVIEQASGSNLLDYGVWMDMSYPHVVGIFGTRGTGKSFDLGVLAECVAGAPDVCAGRPPESATVFFDIQSQFWTLSQQPSAGLPEDHWQIAALQNWGIGLSAMDRVLVWYPRGTDNLVPGAVEFGISPRDLSPDDWLALLRLERFSAMGQALLTVIDRHGPAHPSELAGRMTGSMLRDFQASTLDAVRWRLDSLSLTHLIEEPGIDLNRFLKPGMVSVLLLRNLGEELRALVVAVVTRKLADRMSRLHQQARVARRVGGKTAEAEVPDRLWLFLDEAHVVVPREGSTAATEAVIDYVKRGRDAGLSLVFATQQPSAVDNRLMSQVDLTLTHSLSFESDLQAAVARMPTRTAVKYTKAGLAMPTLVDALRSLDPGQTIVADAMNGRVFVAQIRPRVTAHGGNTPNTTRVGL